MICDWCGRDTNEDLYTYGEWVVCNRCYLKKTHQLMDAYEFSSDSFKVESEKKEEVK
jgi:hypothetical protein